MRIFNSFLVMFGTVILWMLPITLAIYDFRTDLRTDELLTSIGIGEVSANVSLSGELYDDDIGSVSIYSSVGSDNAHASSYNATPRWLLVIGLTDNSTRVLDVSYDVSALDGHDAVGILMDWTPLIWYLLIICFPAAAVYAIVTGRA